MWVAGDLQVSAFTYKFQITIPTSISIGPFPLQEHDRRDDYLPFCQQLAAASANFVGAVPVLPPADHLRVAIDGLSG